MTNHDEAIEFRRLGEVDPGDLIELMNDPAVRRHLPLAPDDFGESECAAFVAAKERMWDEVGYGPWAFVHGGELVGWGGLQPEGDDVDVGMILRSEHWGAGKALYSRILEDAFGELGLASVIALLPPSRTRVAGMRRLGFRRDGELLVGGERFLRYRLARPERVEPDGA